MEAAMKLSPSLSSWRTGPAVRGRRAGLACACAVALLLLSGAVAAQDNDDDGVLPYAPNPVNNGSDGGGSGASASSVVGISSTLEATTVDPQVAAVRVSSTSSQAATVAEGVAPEEATFVAKPGTAVAQQSGDTVLLQGDGQLIAAEPQPMRLERAQEAKTAVALLVLDDGTASLSDLLAGKAALSQVVVVGDVASVSAQTFQAMVDNHAEALAGQRVTLVFASVDKHGQLHVSGLAATTDGEPLELVTR
jgi:hypothetical protein